MSSRHVEYVLNKQAGRQFFIISILTEITAKSKADETETATLIYE